LLVARSKRKTQAPSPDERHDWDRLEQEGENSLWYNRFLLYLHMLPGARSLLGSVHRYEEQIGREKRSANVSGSWYARSQRYRWKERAAAYDDHCRREEEAQLEAERAAILKRGYAQMHRRVEKLNRLAEKLELLIDEDGKLWLPDVKSVGNGPYAQRVDLITFNDALIREYRAAMADIAAELGERVKATRTELSGGIDVTGARDALLGKLMTFAAKSESDALQAEQSETPTGDDDDDTTNDSAAE
jgi:hypothetical protein